MNTYGYNNKNIFINISLLSVYNNHSYIIHIHITNNNIYNNFYYKCSFIRYITATPILYTYINMHAETSNILKLNSFNPYITVILLITIFTINLERLG